MKKIIIGTLFLVGCANMTPQQVTNAVFNDVQTACLASELAAQDLTGEPQVIATNVALACQIAQPLLADVQAVVNSFITASKAKAAKH